MTVFGEVGDQLVGPDAALTGGEEGFAETWVTTEEGRDNGFDVCSRHVRYSSRRPGANLARGLRGADQDR